MCDCPFPNYARYLGHERALGTLEDGHRVGAIVDVELPSLKQADPQQRVPKRRDRSLLP
jgi:hypothetical protein